MAGQGAAPRVRIRVSAFGLAAGRCGSCVSIPNPQGEAPSAGRDQADNFRHADTNMRGLTEEEFLRGKDQLRRAVQHAGHTARTQTRTNWLDLLVLR